MYLFVCLSVFVRSYTCVWDSMTGRIPGPAKGSSRIPRSRMQVVGGFGFRA